MLHKKLGPSTASLTKVIKMICEQKKCILLRGALEKEQEQLKFDGISYQISIHVQFNFNSHISHVNFEAP